MKVSQPDKLEDHFIQLCADFKDIDITLDSTKGRNPSDLRYYSYDPNAYVAKGFTVYDRLPIPKLIFARTPKPQKSSDTQRLVEQKIQKIDQGRIPIAPDYSTYLRIGFALASEFGESGRDYFHRAVRHHQKYNFRHTDKQYSACLSPGGITIATFFEICKKHNI